MGIAETLSSLALGSLVDGAADAVGGKVAGKLVEGVVAFLKDRFTDHSQRLTVALGKANDRGWKALEVALAGESFWERCQLRLGRSEDKAFRDQVRAFLDSVPAAHLPAAKDEFRRQCLQELRQARKAGLLTVGALSPQRLAEEAGAFARYSDPQELLQAEKQAVGGMAEELRQAGHANLGKLLDLGDGPSLLVVSARYFLRRAVEEDAKLFQGLAFVKLERLQEGQERGFAALQDLLSDQGDRLEGLLDEVQAVVVETHATVLDIQQELADQGRQNRDLYKAVLELQRRFDMAHTELRPRDSLSIRGDAERQLVKDLVNRYRGLPEDERQKLPALLNALGKLQVAAGSFQQAERDFAAVAGLVEDPKAKAEAHFNAYRAALEARDWKKALGELLQAVRLDARRFAPFPVGKYIPQRILGAGGFGVVFLCKHKYMNQPVVVKTLLDDQLDRRIDQLFTEAQVLRSLDHPAIVRLQDCGYTDAAAKSRPYMVMDYFDGVTLEDHVKGNGALPPEQLRKVAKQVAEGLLAAHRKNILHRDVKPANVLVREEENGLKVQLIDFGLALPQQVLRATQKRSQTLMGSSIAGTLEYAAPEQMGRLPGVAVGPYSDVYGFGKTCSYALFQTAQPVLKHWQSIPEPLADLLSRCMGEKPEERPVDFDTVLRCLDRLGKPGQVAVGAGRAAEKLPAALPADHDSGRVTARRPPKSAEGRRPAVVSVLEDDEPPPRKKFGPATRFAGVPVWAWGAAGGALLVLLLVVGGVVGAVWMMRRPVQAVATTPEAPPPLVAQQPDRTPTTRRSTISGPVSPLKPPPPDKDGRVYLSDMAESNTGSFATFWKFGKNGELGNNFSEKIKVNGQPAAKGLSTHPPDNGFANVQYLVNPAESLHATVAIDDSSSGARNDVIFEVLGDGKSLWKSRPLRKRGDTDECNVSLKGVQVLDLRVSVSGKGGFTNDGAHAVWIDPYLTRATDGGDPTTQVTKEPDKTDPKEPKPIDTPSAVAPPKIPWQGTKAYLSDMDEAEFVKGAWPLGKNGLTGEDGKSAITVNGVRSPKGLGTHPKEKTDCRVKYRLGKQAALFEAGVALNDGSRASFASVTFEVLGDGKALWTSRSVKKTGEVQSCRLDVKNVDVLELRTSADGWEIGCHAVWIDPTLLRAATEAPAARAWVVGPELKVGDLSAHELGDGATNVLPCLAFAGDGKAFFVLESGGTLRRIATEGFQEEKRVDLGSPAKALAVSKQGLLVLVETPQVEFWLLDPKDLKKLKGGPLPEAVRLAASPGLSTALAEGKPNDAAVPRIRVIDLAKFLVTVAYTERDLTPFAATKGAETSQYQLTPDGRFVVGCTSLGGLVRWKVATGTRLVFDEAGPNVTPGAGGQVVLGGDGQHVCLLHPGGNQAPSGEHPVLDQPGTYVYEVRNLQKPDFALTQGKGLSVLAFDPKTDQVYSNNASNVLIRFSAKGAKQKEYQLQGGAARQIVAHPDGRKLLLLTEGRLFWAEVPAE